MDSQIAGFVTLGLLAICNLLAFAYGYGKLTQKVNDLCRRLDRLERRQNLRKEGE